MTEGGNGEADVSHLGPWGQVSWSERESFIKGTLFTPKFSLLPIKFIINL